MDIEQMKKELAELRAYKEAAERQEPEPYDAGFLNDFGGGNVSWWHDYIRAELDRAHDHYAQQFTVPADKPVTRQDVIDVLLSTRGQSDGVTADAILGLLSDKAAAAVPDAIQLLQRVAASTTDKPAVAVPDFETWWRSLPSYRDADKPAAKMAWDYLARLVTSQSHNQQSAKPGLRMKPHLAGDESTHFMNCNRCGTPFDMRDLNAVMAHEGDRCPSHESEQGGDQ